MIEVSSPGRDRLRNAQGHGTVDLAGSYEHEWKIGDGWKTARARPTRILAGLPYGSLDPPLDRS